MDCNLSVIETATNRTCTCTYRYPCSSCCTCRVVPGDRRIPVWHADIDSQVLLRRPLVYVASTLGGYCTSDMVDHPPALNALFAGSPFASRVMWPKQTSGVEICLWVRANLFPTAILWLLKQAQHGFGIKLEGLRFAKYKTLPRIRT